ncbi:MAG: iron-containing alcohol dehydrogenase [Firmicutes bacterium]|nr:iron-containing alcohol dehydrogenase [Bacillota bacterium]
MQVITGIGCSDCLPEEVEKLKARKVLLITDEGVRGAGLTEEIEGNLKACCEELSVYDDVPPEPAVKDADKLGDAARELRPDVIVGVGGGSVLDMAKGAAVLANNPGSIKDYFGTGLVKNPSVPTIMLPTTAGTGSEVTPNAIFLDEEEKLKVGVVSPYNFARVAIVDAKLTLSAPPRLTASTGVDAFTHAVESYTSVRASVHSDLFAAESIRRIARSLRTVVANPGDLEARYDMALGSVYGGIALSMAGTGGVHALAYPLGGTYRIPHGVSNALLLPYVMEFNYLANLEKFCNVARLMGEPTEGLSLRDGARKALEAIKALVEDVGIPSSLQEVGVDPSAASELADAASQVTRLLANNPRRISRDEIQAIYERAM